MPGGAAVSSGGAAGPGRERLVRWALMACVLALTLWLRTLPLSLPITNDWAERVVRDAIRSRLMQESPAQLDARLTQSIERNRAQFEAERSAVAARLQSELRYEAAGSSYVYLGDLDSYAWLRTARNYLRTGTTCDAVVGGECRDTYVNAPVGARMVYGRSLHIAAIVALHRLLTLFKPGYPLPASSFWVPVIIGVLGVLPSFWIGRRLAGDLGGLLAAVLIAVHPAFLSRSIGSDNDVWNVVLPLFMLWAVTAAVDARNQRRAAALAVVGGCVAGLHAVTWRGWPFSYAAVAGGLAGNILLLGVHYAVRRRTRRVELATALRRAAVVAAVFWVVTGLFTSLAAVEDVRFGIPTNLLDRAAGVLLPQHTTAAADPDLWPNVFSTVAELVKPDRAGIITLMGGPLLFLGSFIGLIVLLLPKRGWAWTHWSVLITAGVSALLICSISGLSQAVTLGLLSVPLAGALVVYVFGDPVPGDIDRAGPLVISVWFLGGLFIAYGGVRFLLLLVAPFSLALSAAAGRLYESARGWMDRRAAPYRPAVSAGLLALFALILVAPIRAGYTAARSYVPRMSDAWWDTLTHLRNHSPPDAIVNTWSDYGYWVKYVAERRAATDGGTLSSHVHYWLGRALVAPTERESVGVLRMLGCGSDATPAPEGEQGAYGKLLARLRDPIAAHDMVLQLVQLDAAEARTFLADRGFDEAAQSDVLRATHCTPPEAFLILSGEQLRGATSWMQLGQWDFRKAYVARKASRLPEPEAVADLVQHHGYSKADATTLYAQARAFTSDGERDTFIAPRTWYLSPQWHPCPAAAGEATLRCIVNLGDSQGGRVLDTFIYDPAAPQNSRLRSHALGGGQPTDGTPAAIILAGAQHEEEITLPSPTHPDFAVLVDVPHQRILVGTPLLVRSTFVHLMFLDGRYASHYEKFDERTNYAGDRIVTWRVRWN